MNRQIETYAAQRRTRSQRRDGLIGAAADFLQRPLVIAGLIAGVLIVWLASGLLGDRATPTAAPAASGGETELFAVEVKSSQAELIARFVEAQAVVAAERILTLRTQVSGVVEELPAARGARLAEGEVIARLSVGDRRAQLDQTNARLAEAEQDYEAATRLAERGYETTARVRAAFSALEAARAAVRAAQEDFDNLTITAPFNGVLDTLEIELGEYLGVGAELGRLVDSDPLIAEARIPQQSIRQVRVGAEARVSLVTGEQRTGRVRYVSANADPATRTFLVEVVLANPDGEIPAGVSGQVSIPVDEVLAHFISPAILTLDEAGALGVKVVTSNDTVEFRSVEIVRAEADGIWIAGLPESARIITTGQGFVGAGERVRPMDSAAYDTARRAMAEAGRARRAGAPG